MKESQVRMKKHGTQCICVYPHDNGFIQQPLGVSNLKINPMIYHSCPSIHFHSKDSKPITLSRE